MLVDIINSSCILMLILGNSKVVDWCGGEGLIEMEEKSGFEVVVGLEGGMWMNEWYMLELNFLCWKLNIFFWFCIVDVFIKLLGFDRLMVFENLGYWCFF